MGGDRKGRRKSRRIFHIFSIKITTATSHPVVNESFFPKKKNFMGNRFPLDHLSLVTRSSIYSHRDGITSSSSILFWEESRVVKPDFASRPCPPIRVDLQFFFFLPSWKSLCVRHANAMPPPLLMLLLPPRDTSLSAYHTTTNIKMRKRTLPPDPTYVCTAST